MHQICFYVPETHLEKVKTALFKEGAGQLDSYDSCCWETEGMGQFRPLKGSTPYIGENNVIEKIREFKVEMICQERCFVSVLKKLIEVHPYETPAYSVYRVNTIKDYL